MSDPYTDALQYFAHGGYDAPYDIEAGWPKRQMVQVDPADCATGYAAPRLSGLIHHVIDAAIASDGDHTQVGARFACRTGSPDVLVVPKPEDRDPVCRRCIRYSQRYPALYRFFDATGRLLYIGATVDVIQRIEQHEKTAAWWPEVDERQIERFDSIGEARLAEAHAIHSERPIYNKILQRDGRRKRSVA